VDVAFMARTAEALGFESLWCAEHPICGAVHQPFPGLGRWVIPRATRTSSIRSSPWRGRPEVTTTLRLGTGITLFPNDPLLLAKEISTLDLFSGGRFLLGSAPAGTGKRPPSWAETSITAGPRRVRRSWP